MNSQLEEEKSTTKRQLIEIRNLKDRIDAEKKKMTDMLKNGKGVSAEATRRSTRSSTRQTRKRPL